MDFSLFERLDHEMSSRADKMLRYCQSQTNVTVATAAAQLTMLVEVVGNVSPKVYGTLLLLPLIFGEDKEDLFKTAEDIITSADLEQHDDLPHPHVVIRGNHPFENNCYAVVEGCILAENVTLRMAVGLTIAAYYNLNITYPESIANTLEFIQRIFLGINPQRGSKVRKTDKRRPAFSTKVRKLIDNLRDFDNDISVIY
ncbi:uncharacterized protein LOC143242754 [Tachypleus tridentatus]|uniref:uncharacterized protein LOC143242754 n=1 Tax=Tachypleus tridentatus TaxID=6853 RepID=UPI003FD4AD11